MVRLNGFFEGYAYSYLTESLAVFVDEKELEIEKNGKTKTVTEKVYYVEALVGDKFHPVSQHETLEEANNELMSYLEKAGITKITFLKEKAEAKEE